MVLPSADMASLPCPPFPPGQSCASAFQVLPPSSEIAACADNPLPPLPMRTMTSGLPPAYTMSRVLANRSPAKVPSAGETSTSSWRKPSMSPTPLIKCAPVGGLTSASGTVSSSPLSRKIQVTRPPESAAVALVEPDAVAGAKKNMVGIVWMDRHAARPVRRVARAGVWSHGMIQPAVGDQNPLPCRPAIRAAKDFILQTPPVYRRGQDGGRILCVNRYRAVTPAQPLAVGGFLR